MSRHRRPDVDLIRQVAEHHREALLVRAREMSDNPHFVSGLSWQLHALDRVLLACAGETDPGRLGLTAAPDPEPEVEQDSLFDLGGAA